MADIRFPNDMKTADPEMGSIVMISNPKNPEEPFVTTIRNIRSLLTGIISAGNESFATGGQVFTLQQLISQVQSKVELKADQASLEAEARTRRDQAVVNFSYDPSTRELLLTKYDQTRFSIILPQADPNQSGFMTPEDVITFQDIISKVQSITEGGLWRASFDTYADLQAAYPNLNVSSTNWLINDFVYVLHDENRDPDLKPETSYIVTVDEETKTLRFRKLEDVPIRQATQDFAGVVKGSVSQNGKIYIESDGSMSLIGWDILMQSIDTIANSIPTPADDTNGTGKGHYVYIDENDEKRNNLLVLPAVDQSAATQTDFTVLVGKWGKKLLSTLFRIPAADPSVNGEGGTAGVMTAQGQEKLNYLSNFKSSYVNESAGYQNFLIKTSIGLTEANHVLFTVIVHTYNQPVPRVINGQMRIENNGSVSVAGAMVQGGRDGLSVSAGNLDGNLSLFVRLANNFNNVSGYVALPGETNTANKITEITPVSENQGTTLFANFPIREVVTALDFYRAPAGGVYPNVLNCVYDPDDPGEQWYAVLQTPLNLSAGNKNEPQKLKMTRGGKMFYTGGLLGDVWLKVVTSQPIDVGSLDNFVSERSEFVRVHVPMVEVSGMIQLEDGGGRIQQIRTTHPDTGGRLSFRPHPSYKFRDTAFLDEVDQLIREDTEAVRSIMEVGTTNLLGACRVKEWKTHFVVDILPGISPQFAKNTDMYATIDGISFPAKQNGDVYISSDDKMYTVKQAANNQIVLRWVDTGDSTGVITAPMDISGKIKIWK
jgi:hypothetical protein